MARYDTEETKAMADVMARVTVAGYFPQGYTSWDMIVVEMTLFRAK